MRRLTLHFATIAVLGVLVAAALSGGIATGTVAENQPNVTLYVTETPAFEGTQFETAADVERAIANGTLEPDDQMLVNHTLVVALDSERLAADLDGRSGTTSERFFATLEDELTFSLVSETRPNTANLNVPLGPENTTVSRNGTTTYVSIDTGALDAEWLRGSERDPDVLLFPGIEYEVRFGYDVGEEELETVGPRIQLHRTLAEPWGPYGDEWPELLAPELTNLSVNVNVEPDERMLLRLELEDGPTLTKEPGEVPWSGFVGASFDLRDVRPGTNYTLGLIHDGTLVGRQNGTVRALDATLRNASVTLADAANVSDSVEYAAEISMTANLSHGGQIQVFDDQGRDIGFKWVAPGETDVHIRVPDSQYPGEFTPDELTVRAVRRHGSDVDQYPGDGAEMTLNVSGYDWGTSEGAPTETLTPTGTPTATVTGTATQSPPESSTERSTGTETQTRTDETSGDGDGPGFTAVAVVGALLTLLGVSRHRRNG